MQRVRKQINADDYMQEWMKREVVVAVLDTGMGRHPDLNGKVLSFRDFVGGKKYLYDNNGHGTHVSGIICGNGQLSNGLYRGIAPGAKLVIGKILDENGDGMTKNMLASLQWILDSKEKLKIKILNISVGIGELRQYEKEAALKHKIEEVWDSGIVVVCAAGNKGPGNGTISSIGESNKVITVGCHDGEFCWDNRKRCETYSSRGNRNEQIRKPDLVAPGTDIISCNANMKWKNGSAQNPYTMKSGTSMSTPIVTGCAVLLLQKYPELTNEDIKKYLIQTASDLGEPWNKQGYGMINAKGIFK